MTPEDPPPDRPLNRWLARLSFSFFIISGWLVWETYKLVMIARQDGVSPPIGRISLYLIAAVMGVALGGAGVRERHRSQW